MLRRFTWAITVVCLLIWVAGYGTATAAEPPSLPSAKANRQQAAEAVADKVVAVLPDDIHLRLLAVADFEGDDGTLVDALTSRIKAGTRFRLIERRDLDKLLSEQGITLSPIGDPRSPVEPGKIKGVEALMLGKVSQTTSILFSNMEVFIKLDNAESGEVVLAQSFQATYVPQASKYGAILLAVILVLLLFSRQKRRRAAGQATKRASKDAGALQTMSVQLKKVRQNINQAHDVLVERKSLEQAVSVREVRDDLSRLISKVELHPGLQPAEADRGTAKTAAVHAKSTMALIINLAAESEKMLAAVISGNDSPLAAALETVKTEIKNTQMRFSEKP